MKIVIAGCGWLGTELAGILKENGHSVAGTRRSIPALPVEFPILIYDPEQPVDENTQNAFLDADAVVLSFPPDRAFKEKYAEDCLHVAELCGEKTKLIMVSSTSVYPDLNTHFKEDDIDTSISNPIISAEKALADLAGDRLTIIRMAGLFGKDRVIVNHMSKSGKTYNGNERVNLIHLEDAAGICAFVIEKRISGAIFNACAAGHPPKSEFYAWLAGKFGILPPQFENTGNSGKTINSERSRNAGYVYKKDDPYTFIL